MSFFKSVKNSLSDNLNWVSGDIAIDIGTANTLIWLSGKGIIINEPSIIARNSKTQALLAVGDDAKLMQGKTHEGIEIIRIPLYPDHSMSIFKRMLMYISFAISFMS